MGPFLQLAAKIAFASKTQLWKILLPPRLVWQRAKEPGLGNPTFKLVHVLTLFPCPDTPPRAKLGSKGHVEDTWKGVKPDRYLMYAWR